MDPIFIDNLIYFLFKMIFALVLIAHVLELLALIILLKLYGAEKG